MDYGTDRFEVQEKNLEGNWECHRLFDFQGTALRCFREGTLEGMVLKVVDRKTGKVIAD